MTNDLELADICVKSSSIISKLSAVKNHPFVENAEAELEKMKEEKQEAMEEFGEGLFNGNLKMGSSEAVRSDEKEYKEKDKR